jgi:hypothetical protein
MSYNCNFESTGLSCIWKTCIPEDCIGKEVEERDNGYIKKRTC